MIYYGERELGCEMAEMISKSKSRNLDENERWEDRPCCMGM
jgi:hypothetical protein